MEEGRCREIQRGGEVVFKGEEKDIQDGCTTRDWCCLCGQREDSSKPYTFYLANENAPKSGEHTDAENPKEGQAGPQHQGHQSNIGADGKQRYPPNYGICFEFIKLVCKGMLAILLSILGFGFISFFKYGTTPYILPSLIFCSVSIQNNIDSRYVFLCGCKDQTRSRE
uniref:Uncharacterized protein n=1 Tax=Vitis vinifera TaxID=29760 RepID=F6HBH9_VITVI